MFETDAYELQEVLRRDPDRQPPQIDRRVSKVADADTGDAQPIFERIKRPERLAEGFADAVPGIGTYRSINVDASSARIKADHVIRRGEYHPFDAVTARRLEQVVATDNIGVQDRLPRSFDGESAEMHDPLDAGDRPADFCHAGEIGFDERFLGRKIGRAPEVG